MKFIEKPKLKMASGHKPLVENAILKLLPEMDFIPMPYVKVKKSLKIFFLALNSSKK